MRLTSSSLRILLSSYTLDWAGVPTYTLTLYQQLILLGHQVMVYSPKGGDVAALMLDGDGRSAVVSTLDGVKAPDVIIAQHNKCAVWLRGAFRRRRCATPSRWYTCDYVSLPRRSPHVWPSGTVKEPDN